MKKLQNKILYLVDEIQQDTDKLCEYYKNGLIPTKEEVIYTEKIRARNNAILKLIQAIIYLDESEEYQNENK